MKNKLSGEAAASVNLDGQTQDEGEKPSPYIKIKETECFPASARVKGKPPLTPCGHNNYGCKHGCVLTNEENDIHSLKYKTPHCPLPTRKIKCDDMPSQIEDKESEQDEVCSLIAQKLGHVCGSVNIVKAEKEAREILCLYSKKEVEPLKKRNQWLEDNMMKITPADIEREKQQAVEKALAKWEQKHCPTHGWAIDRCDSCVKEAVEKARIDELERIYNGKGSLRDMMTREGEIYITNRLHELKKPCEAGKHD